jgi:hypothetical protein
VQPPEKTAKAAEEAALLFGLEWGLEADAELALRLAASLDGFWAVTDPSEGVRWLDTLLRRAPDAPLELRARAFRAYGSSANPAGDDALAERCYQQSVDAYREVGDERGVAAVLLRLGYSAFYRGDSKRAGELAALSLALSRKVGYGATESQALGLSGEVLYAQGDREAGAELIERSASLAEEVGFPWWRSRMLRKLVDCMLELGRRSDAEGWARESLRILDQIGDRQMMMFALVRLARIAAETGRGERAGLLWGPSKPRRRAGRWERGRRSESGSPRPFSLTRDPNSSAAGRREGCSPSTTPSSKGWAMPIMSRFARLRRGRTRTRSGGRSTLSLDQLTL